MMDIRKKGLKSCIRNKNHTHSQKRKHIKDVREGISCFCVSVQSTLYNSQKEKKPVPRTEITGIGFFWSYVTHKQTNHVLICLKKMGLIKTKVFYLFSGSSIKNNKYSAVAIVVVGWFNCICSLVLLRRSYGKKISLNIINFEFMFYDWC